jgi:TM2 domain-containing membrane protein YozV
MSDTPHHISDIDTWKVADRNKYIFLALSVLGGFFGLDHVYLRSYGTAFQKTMMNIFGLGFWYFWDLLQVATEGKKVLKEGLTSPFDWKRGIGRGVFADDMLGGITSQEGGSLPPQKDYLIYTLLTFLGFLGANHFYLGNTAEGIVKLFMHFNIFLVLFGVIWSMYDSFNAVFRTADVLKEGISAPVPLSSFFETTPGSIFVGGAHPELNEAEANKKGFFQTLMDLFLGFVGWFASWLPLPPVPNFSGIKTLAKETIPLVVTPPIVKAIKEIQAPGLAPGLAAVPGLPAGLPSIPTELPTMPSVLPMKGGGYQEIQEGPGPAIAGVLAAVVLAGGLKGMYDFVNKHFA